jgi:hypothetical protein
MFTFFFIVEFVFLFLLARYLINSLSRLFFRVSRSEKVTVALLAYLFLPGTIVHELSHLLAAGLLFVGAGNMQLTPKIIEDGVRLGSVEIEKTDILRRAIIGVAPVLVGATVIFGTLFYLQSLNFLSAVSILISVIIIFEVSNTLFSSKKDLEGTLEFVITLSVISAGVVIIKPGIMQNFLSFFQKVEIVNFFKNADLFLLAPILIDTLLIMITRLFIRNKVSFK